MNNEVKICEFCGITEFTSSIHVHHVVGRVGLDKNKPENLINLCWSCHHKWHNARTEAFENWLYDYMKTKYGDKFPIKVNGYPKYTKWIARIEREQEK